MFLVPKSYGQVREVPHLTIGDGLSNNSITVLFQDNNGFLWIGTEDGLNRYDGYEFKTFRHNPSEPFSISGNHVQAIVQDNDSNLWIGTRNSGLCKLDYSTGKFVSYYADIESENSLPENGVYGLLVDPNNQLWIKTQSYLSLYKGEEEGFDNFGHYCNIFNVKNIGKSPIYIESDTSLLVGTKDGLNRFNINSNYFTRVTCLPTVNFTCQDAVFDIVPYNNQYLVATSSGVQRLKIAPSGSSEVISFEKNNGMGGRVNDLMQTENGSIFVGTHGGLRIFDPSTNRYRQIQLKENRHVPYHVTAMTEDRSGMIWIGTRFNGVFKLDLSPSKFKSFSEKSSAGSQVNDFNFQSIYEDNEGYIWLGTLNQGIYRYHPQTSDIHHYIIDSESYRADADAVYVLHKDSSGRLWAGTSNGLYYYKQWVNHFVEYDYNANVELETLLRGNNIHALANDADGNLWIGTRFGLYRLIDGRMTSFFYNEEDSTGLLSDQINALCLDESEHLWIGTEGGLNVRNHATEKIMRVPLNDANSRINRSSVLSLTIGNKGRIWAGTRSGLWIIPSMTERPFQMSGNENLDNDMIKAVVPDDANRAWVSTNKGIACLNADGTAFNFDIFDGLPGYVFNTGSVFKNRAGTLFFGGAEGLCWFHPDSIEYNLTKPPLSLTNISVSSRGEKAEEFWPIRESLELKYRPFTSLNVEFSALEFTHPSKNRYKVFLKGYDPDWRPVTSKNSVSFSNLLPGTYTLKVLASNNDFTWNNEPLEVEIKVKPPLWMSNYAFAFYLLALIFVIHILINYRVRHYRKANRALQEKTVNKKQIEAQREVLTRINRSLTDSINYARRIQRAMIPSEIAFRNLFPESFVYLQARDIVSGDFYWFHEKGDKVFVTAVDCTGHGVPGAFMSIIGLDLLNNIIEVQGLESPAEILKTMNAELIHTLRKDQSSMSDDGDVNDGMDMSLLVINRQDKTLEFAGAYNGFYLVRDNEIHTYKGNRFPIGYLKDNESPSFSTQKVLLRKNDVLYLFTDGLPDQFGGTEHKKYKYRRFRLLLLHLHQMNFPDQKTILHQKIEAWMGIENEQVDDMLVVGFKPLL